MDKVHKSRGDKVLPKIITIILIIILPILTLGCGSAGYQMSKPVEGGTFRFGLNLSPRSLDPARIEDNSGAEIAKEIYDGLVKYDPQTLEVKPAIAEKWDFSADKKTITFHIRQGVKFHDGTEVKAQDVLDDWNRLAAKDTASPVAYLLEPIAGFRELNNGITKTMSGLKVKDEYTVEVNLTKPTSAFITSLGHPAASIYRITGAISEGKDFGTPASSPENLIGTGAFEFVKWIADQEVTLVKFHDYYGKKAYLDQIEYKIYKYESSAIADFCAGKLDFINRISPQQQDSLSRELPGQTKINPVLAIEYFGFNLNKAPFKDNLNLRKAIAYAVNVKNIAETVRQGMSTAAAGPIPAGMPGYDKDLQAPTYDKVKAKQYLALAGYPEGNGLPAIQYIYNFTQLNQKVAQALQEQLKGVGINLELKDLDWASYIKAVQSGDSQMFRLAWTAAYPDPDNFLRMLYSKSQWGLNNVTYYSNQEVEDLLSRASFETDNVKRMEIFKNVQEKVIEDQPAVWAFNNTYLELIGYNVRDLTLNALDQKDMRTVWLSQK